MYPRFTPHCGTDPIRGMKPALHAAAGSRLYADLGGKPCFVEEVNTLGPMFGDDDVAASYVRSMLFQIWAHDARGVMWWCANDQSHLGHTPYDWDVVERELGLFRPDGSAKPALDVLSRFGAFVRGLPFGALPLAIVDAVCVLTRDQDAWAVAYGAFMLAQQAGLNLRFAWHEDELPRAQAYLLPSQRGSGPIARR
ncbi:MAG: beta-mannanase, partial [Clostridiales bacterium]|nr:beta-mannanase [Clostridiales bacterium]